MQTSRASGATHAALVASMRARLGPPTAVDGARLSWASLSRDGCRSVTLTLESRGTSIDHQLVDRIGIAPLDYERCLDLARGAVEVARFEAAAVSIRDADPTEDGVVAAAGPQLGEPSARAEGAGLDLAWATTTADRCVYLRASIADEVVHPEVGAPRVGMPWFAECQAWASGVPTALGEDDIASAALYARLTAPGGRARVDAAVRMYLDASDAHRGRDDAATHDELARRLGPPNLTIAGHRAWAIADDAHCAALWQYAGVGARVLVEDLRPSGDAPWIACGAVARGDARLAAVVGLAPRLVFEDGLGEPAAIAALGPPSRTMTVGGDTTRTWAVMDGARCASAWLTTGAVGAQRLRDAIYEPGDARHAACEAAALASAP